MDSAAHDGHRTPSLAEVLEVLRGLYPEDTAQSWDQVGLVTGDQPATDAQKSYLDSLARQAGEQIPADLTKAEASEHIDRLQAATGRDQQGRQQP